MRLNSSEEDENVRSNCEEDVKMETVTVIGKSRWNLTCFMY